MQTTGRSECGCLQNLFKPPASLGMPTTSPIHPLPVIKEMNGSQRDVSHPQINVEFAKFPWQKPQHCCNNNKSMALCSFLFWCPLLAGEHHFVWSPVSLQMKSIHIHIAFCFLHRAEAGCCSLNSLKVSRVSFRVVWTKHCQSSQHINILNSCLRDRWFKACTTVAMMPQILSITIYDADMIWWLMQTAVFSQQLCYSHWIMPLISKWWKTGYITSRA